MPTSLAERAGASLIPSPTMATGPTRPSSPLDRVDLLSRHQLGLDGHPEFPRNYPAAGRVIAREHGDVQPRSGQPVNHIAGARAATLRRKQTGRTHRPSHPTRLTASPRDSASRDRRGEDRAQTKPLLVSIAGCSPARSVNAEAGGVADDTEARERRGGPKSRRLAAICRALANSTMPRDMACDEAAARSRRLT